MHTAASAAGSQEEKDKMYAKGYRYIILWGPQSKLKNKDPLYAKTMNLAISLIKEDYFDEKGYKIEKLEEPKEGKKASLDRSFDKMVVTFEWSQDDEDDSMDSSDVSQLAKELGNLLGFKVTSVTSEGGEFNNLFGVKDLKTLEKVIKRYDSSMNDGRVLVGNASSAQDFRVFPFGFNGPSWGYYNWDEFFDLMVEIVAPDDDFLQWAEAQPWWRTRRGSKAASPSGGDANKLATQLLGGKTAAPGGPEDLAGAYRAFIAVAKLPLRASGEPSPGKEPVRVPAGFESLFERIWIEIKLYSKYNVWEFSWDYEHPNGGTNGLSIGSFGFYEETGKWMYQLSQDRGKWKIL